MSQVSSEKAWEWSRVPGIDCAGRAFLGGELLSADRLAKELLTAHDDHRLLALLRELNGSFAFVIRKDGEVRIAGVDRVRSIPLFYRRCTTSGGYDIATMAEALVTEATAAPGVAERAAFLRSGYVLADRTLHPEVFQVEAGTIVEFVARAAPVKKTYFQHVRCSGWDRPEMGTFADLDALSARVGQRLVDVLGGRQALIPLSGGYDSRYIVSLLAEAGYQNVQMFTYGTASGFEARIAGKVAEQVGFPWEFVDYTDDGLSNFVNSEQFENYWASAGNLSSLPHVQEPYAIATMIERGLVAGDAVAVPGFCGDVLGGSFMPVEFTTGDLDNLESEGLASHLLKRFLYLDNDLTGEEAQALNDALECQILDMSLDLSGPVELYSAANAWAAANRLSKFVINALRCYEAFDLDWYMPLWDTELVDYWYQCPIDQLKQKALYNGYLLDHRFKGHQIEFRQYPGYWSSATFKRFRSLVPQGLVNPLWRLRDMATGTRRFDVNSFGPIADWANQESGPSAPSYDGNINRVLVHRYLRDLAVAANPEVGRRTT